MKNRQEGHPPSAQVTASSNTVVSVRPKKGANLNMSFQTDAVFPEDTMMIVKNQVVKSISATKRRHQSNLPRFSADRDPEVLMNDTRLSTTTELC